jgi:hypothetical protein
MFVDSNLWDLRLGRWENVLKDVGHVNAIICDPPYSSRTHDGHDDGATLANRAGKGWNRSSGGVDAFRPRREISYSNWTKKDVEAFVAAWAPRCLGWMVCLSDSVLCEPYRASYERHGLTGFAPVGILIPGMTVRMAGDGPSSWMLYANVARPKSLSKWGTLPGGYTGGQGERIHVGGKPEWLMRVLVRDYTRKGDLVCDPCSGAGTTLLAALAENRRAIGAEVDPATHSIAVSRLTKGYTPAFDFGEVD